MFLWQLITPNLILSQPIWFLTDEVMAEHGLQGLILDVDNTLVGNDEVDIPPEVKQWVEVMRQKYKIWLISNNFSDRRIKNIADTLQLPYRSRAGKPSRRAVRRAILAMDLPAEKVAMVGDRLFTDTLVGNRLGMFTVLVQPPPMLDQKASLLSARSQFLRNWEIWLARKSGVNI